MGRAPHHWRIVTTESNAPVAPAASLLFQAPVFQAAPEVAPPAAFEEPETKPKRRRGSSDDEASASQEETTPKRRRRSKKSVDEASAPTPDPATDREEADRGQRAEHGYRGDPLGTQDPPSPPLQEGRRGLGSDRGQC